MAQPNYSLLNTNIPAEAASSAMKGMQQVNALSAQRLENDAAQMAIKNALAEQEAYKRSGSLQEAQQNLLRGGLGKQAAALGQNIATQGKTLAETQKIGYELDDKKMGIMRERTKDLLANTSNENYIAHVQEGIRDGLITPEQAQRSVQTYLAIPPNQRVAYLTQQLAKAEDIFKESSTPAIREYKFGQTDPGFTNYQMNKAAAGAARSIVNLPPQEKAEQTERGKFLVEDYKTVNNAARVAARTLPAIEVNLDLLDQGFKTGFSAEVKKGAANILGALGVENANQFATNAQVFQAKANETVLQRQLEQKGPQTESDAQRITQTGAQLTNTAEANKFILDVAKAQLKRDVEQRNFYDSWFTKNKTYDGAENAWYTGDGGKSLFERPELKKYNVQTGSTPQRQGSQQTTGGLSLAEQAELDSLRKRFSASGKK
jgi:hypothetical protein